MSDKLWWKVSTLHIFKMKNVIFLDKKSSLIIHIYFMIEPLAQSVEQQPFKLWVVGSNPTRLTI